MPRVSPTAVALSLAVLPAAAQTKAPFIGDKVYATVDGCVKLKAIAAGGDKNAGTVPEFLTAFGFGGWEESCAFTAIKEAMPGRAWDVAMNCFGGADEYASTERFEFDAATLAITVTEPVEKKSTVFLPCEAPAPTFD
jgi:hypothetical protein